MYARTKTFNNKDGSQRTYIQIVESVRENDKVRQRVVLNLGRIEDLQEGSLDRLVASLVKFSKKKWIQAEAEKLMVHSAREWGLDLIFRHLWEQLGLHNILRSHFAKAHVSFQMTEAVYAMVLNRISDPLSKRGAIQWIDDVCRPSFLELLPTIYSIWSRSSVSNSSLLTIPRSPTKITRVSLNLLRISVIICLKVSTSD